MSSWDWLRIHKESQRERQGVRYEPTQNASISPKMHHPRKKNDAF